MQGIERNSIQNDVDWIGVMVFSTEFMINGKQQRWKMVSVYWASLFYVPIVNVYDYLYFALSKQVVLLKLNMTDQR